MSRFSIYPRSTWNGENVDYLHDLILILPLIISRYLGVALAKVLLASAVPKPILVVCMTNHALDSYLEDLRKSGVKKLARLGGQSKEQWTKEYKLSVISRNVKRTTFERSSLSQCHNQIEC